MATTIKPGATRLQQTLATWDIKQEALIKRYGNGLGNDRDFLKAKRSVLQDVYDKHEKLQLNMDDKIELAILKGQLKQLHERIYPKRAQRIGVGLVKLLYRPLTALKKLTVDFASIALTGKPYYKTAATRRTSANTPDSLAQSGQNEAKSLLQPVPPVEKVSSKHVRRDRVLTDFPTQSMRV